MLNQDAQQFVFFRRKLDLLVADFHDSPDEIDRKIVDVENRRLVVNDKDAERRRAHAAASRRSGSLATGSLIVKIAPWRSERLVAIMDPFMASIKPREMASPSPVPGRTWSLFCTR